MQNGDVDGASVILEHMKDREISINEHVFNSLIVGHARSGNFEEARYHKRFFTLNPKLYGYNFHNESIGLMWEALPFHFSLAEEGQALAARMLPFPCKRSEV